MKFRHLSDVFNSGLWLIGNFSASGQESNEEHSAFFPASIKYEPVHFPEATLLFTASINYEPVDLHPAREKKVINPTSFEIVHEVQHPKKVKFEESNSDCETDFRFGEIPRNNSKRYKRADGEAADISPLHTGADDELEETPALRMRASNVRLSPCSRPNRSDNHCNKKPNTRSSTLYKELKKNDYYFF